MRRFKPCRLRFFSSLVRRLWLQLSQVDLCLEFFGSLWQVIFSAVFRSAFCLASLPEQVPHTSCGFFLHSILPLSSKITLCEFAARGQLVAPYTGSAVNLSKCRILCDTAPPPSAAVSWIAFPLTVL